MRTDWKNGTPKLVHYLVSGSSKEIAELEDKIKLVCESKNNLVMKQEYEKASYLRAEEKELINQLEIAKERGMHYIGPYHNRPSKKLCERKGARVVSYRLVEIKDGETSV
jgi:hypothetical protein